MGQTRWAEPWNRLGDWQASSESSMARKSSNLILPFYSNLRTPTAERTPPFERGSQRKRLPSRRAKKSFLLVQFMQKSSAQKRIHPHERATSSDHWIASLDRWIRKALASVPQVSGRISGLKHARTSRRTVGRVWVRSLAARRRACRQLACGSGAAIGRPERIAVHERLRAARRRP